MCTIYCKDDDCFYSMATKPKGMNVCLLNELMQLVIKTFCTFFFFDAGYYYFVAAAAAAVVLYI